MSQSPQPPAQSIRRLSVLLNLGTPAGELSRVYGGFHHKMWRLDTDRGSYAVKQLSADAYLGDPSIVHHYEVAERIAEAFCRRNIGAIAALRNDDGYLQVIDNAGYLVYPWCTALALERTHIDEHYALKIANLLARMHQANIDVPGVKTTFFEVIPDDHLTELVNRTSGCAELQAHALHEQLSQFIAMSHASDAAKPILKKRRVIGHGDMDQKNVLWNDQDQPVVIDWESARLVNPTYELITVALDWSGIASTFNPELFELIVTAYRRDGGIIDGEAAEAACDRVLGDWLIWFFYVVALLLDEQNPLQRQQQAEQIDFVLPTINRLHQLLPELVAIVRRIAQA